jgi:hypothetical protein
MFQIRCKHILAETGFKPKIHRRVTDSLGTSLGMWATFFEYCNTHLGFCGRSVYYFSLMQFFYLGKFIG